ncbi:MAG: histidine kinase [Silvibacterium sp.]
MANSSHCSRTNGIFLHEVRTFEWHSSFSRLCLAIFLLSSAGQLSAQTILQTSAATSLPAVRQLGGLNSQNQLDKQALAILSPALPGFKGLGTGATTGGKASDLRFTPERYRRELQEAEFNGNSVLSVAVFSIDTQLPIYQTWYFYLALVLLCIWIPVFLFRRHVQQMKGRIGIVLEERSRIARECHDTLMAGFAAISWQLEATAKLFRDSGLASTPAAESCELARSMVSHCQAEARRIIWDLRDTAEITSLLSQALARAISVNHIHQKIETTLDVEGDEVPLAPGCVHHLVCIGQEAVTNALRHAEPNRIVIHLRYEADALNLSIHDDGCGFYLPHSPGSRHGHFGIAVMEERTRKLGGTFRLQTTLGIGTEVAVRVSFNAMQPPTNQEHHVIRWIGI